MAERKTIWPIRIIQIFFAWWWHGLTDTRFALAVSAQMSFGRIFAFVLASYFLFALIRTSIFSTTLLPTWQQGTRDSYEALVSAWSDDLIVRYENNQVSSSPEITTLLPYPASLPTTGLPQNGAWIDLRADAKDAGASAAAFLTVTPTTLWLSSGGGAPISYTWNEMFESPWTLTKTDLRQHDQDVQAAIAAFSSAAITATFFSAWLVVLVVRCLFLLPYAWILQNLFFLRKRVIRYRHAYRLGLFLLPLAEGIGVTWSALYQAGAPQHVFWWIWFALASLILFFG